MCKDWGGDIGCLHTRSRKGLLYSKSCSQSHRKGKWTLIQVSKTNVTVIWWTLLIFDEHFWYPKCPNRNVTILSIPIQNTTKFQVSQVVFVLLFQYWITLHHKGVHVFNPTSWQLAAIIWMCYVYVVTSYQLKYYQSFWAIWGIWKAGNIGPPHHISVKRLSSSPPVD